MTVGLSVDSENIFLVKTDTVVLFLSTKQRAIYQNEHKKINLLDTKWSNKIRWKFRFWNKGKKGLEIAFSQLSI